jgi:diguanylate cyclase (GGDEF)-like protein
MGIKLFYIFALIYAAVSSLGVFTKDLAPHFLYIFLMTLVLYYYFYAHKKKVEFFYSISAGIIANLFVQLTGGIGSPLFLIYPIVLLIIGYKEHHIHYWIIALSLFIMELTSGILNHTIVIAPLVILAVAVVVFGIIIKQQTDQEIALKRSLVKYESRDEFFRPAEFEHEKILTSVRDIDKHPGIERPLLYFVQFIHNIFNAYTTAILSYSDDHLVLVQGFSHSELFRPGTIIDARSGIYYQVISERKPVLIKEFAQDPEELGFYKGELKLSSVIISPIILLDHIEGIFVIDREASQFNETDKQLFTQATTAAGYLLAMIRLYEKERYETKYRKTIAEVAKELQKELDLKSILSNAIQSFKTSMDFDDMSVAKIDEVNNCGVVIESTYIKESTKFSLDEGLVGFVAKHKNTIIKDDLHEGNLIVLKKGLKSNNASFVGVPITQDDELYGVIWLEDHRKKRFSKDDIEQLNILASQLSLAWQRAQLYYQVKDLSIRDWITGLYNHGHFQDLLEDGVKKQKELVLLFIDIDHFKEINDAYGHQAGDAVLRFLGKSLSTTGIASRYGGEEFTIIMPECSLKRGLREAVILKDHIKKSEVNCSHNKLTFTVSIGVAHYPSDAQTRDELIQKADMALYIAKKTGRDKVIAAQTIKTHQLEEEQK